MEVKTINGYDIKDETARNLVSKSVFKENINTEKYYDETSNTTYYITTIPYRDEKGNQNVWKLGIANDDTSFTTSQSTLDFAISKNASICIYC